MSLHFLDESDEPRECPGCSDCHAWLAEAKAALGGSEPRDFRCHGTDRLGNPDGPRVEVKYNASNGPGGYQFRSRSPAFRFAGWSKVYSTSEAALAAAREAHRNV